MKGVGSHCPNPRLHTTARIGFGNGYSHKASFDKNGKFSMDSNKSKKRIKQNCEFLTHQDNCGWSQFAALP